MSPYEPRPIDRVPRPYQPIHYLPDNFCRTLQAACMISITNSGSKVAKNDPHWEWFSFLSTVDLESYVACFAFSSKSFPSISTRLITHELLLSK
jgi:hypothetical protein